MHDCSYNEPDPLAIDLSDHSSGDQSMKRIGYTPAHSIGAQLAQPLRVSASVGALFVAVGPY